MIDISIIARELNLPPEKVQRTVELLDEGNTISFVSRFRKDETGGLDEKQVHAIKQQVNSLRALAERKDFILKSIESQGKLTDDIKVALDKATTSRAVEDVYLPFKPRKKSRAQEARQKGLGPLAEDIYNGTSPEVDLATRATDYVRVDKGLTSVDEVIAGVSDLLAEQFADDAELRNEIRKLVEENGKLTSKATAQEKPAKSADEVSEVPAEELSQNTQAMPSADEPEQAPAEPEKVDSVAASTEPVAAEAKSDTVETEKEESASSDEAAEAATSDDAASEQSQETAAEEAISEPVETADSKDEPTASEPVPSTVDQPAAQAKTKTKSKKKKKKKKRTSDDPFKDYHDYKQPLSKTLHYHVLGINRGERSRKLDVKIDCDEKKIVELAEKKLVPEGHPFADHLKSCVKDALSRLMLPSIEREIRRELTEAAEKHAVDVYSNGLRNLLLQPPMRNRRVLAIHPGYKRGCSVAILEINGEILHTDHVFVVGNQTRREESRKKVADLAKEYSVDLIAIGNGPASREAEQMVSDSIENYMMDNKSIRYVIVSDAGVNIYSTSEVGREELPDASPAVRSAVSIGRRLQDPMSELVKVNPANIGVGMYQHDVKAKHLGESLQEVVQFCVNRVGADANTASASLLSYISGMNPLTARRMVEHRQQKGGFSNREELKEVSGIGDTTFAQAAGFLRVCGGDSPLDSTSIHPENYSIAEEIIRRVDTTAAELFPQEARKVVPVPQEASAETAVEAEPSPEVAEEKPAEPLADAAEQNDDADQNANDESASPTAVEGDTSTSEAEHIPIEGAVSTEPDSEPSDSTSSNESTGEAEQAAAESTPAEVKKVPPPPRPKPSPELIAARKKRREIVERIAALELDSLAGELSAGSLLLTDVVRAMKRPDWDPREKLRKPVMRRALLKVGEITTGQELEAQVVNVVDFGVFVDIGIGESCLVHVSQLSNRYIKDPQVVFTVGDVIKTWVTEVDTEKRRVKLTAIRPGTERSRGQRNKKFGKRDRSSDGANNRSGRKPNRGDRKKSNFKKSWKPKPRKPKPVTPITDELLAGDAPMTSFSDLVQFVKKKPEDKSDK